MTDPPAAKKPRLVGRSSFGSKRELSEVQLVRFEIHDFASLPHKRGESIKLDPLKAHGYSWTLQAFPRGDTVTDDQTESVSLYLARVCSNGADPTVMPSMKCGCYNTAGEEPIVFLSKTPMDWGMEAEREMILDPESNCLDKDGTLTVDVCLQIYREKKPVWFPPLYQPCGTISRLWMSLECADVTFSIGSESITAHKLVLAANAAALFDLVKDFNGEEAVEITGVQVDVFKAMLHYIYTGELAKRDSVEGGEIDTMSLLVTADRFGCTNLKLRVESEVTAHVLDKNNAAEWLMFADSHSCALLKEASVDMFIAHSATVMESAGWPMVEESKALLSELLRAQNLGKNASNNDQNDDIDHLEVSSLRERLEAAGLNVDGSRETLVSRLKNHVAVAGEEENGNSSE